MASIRKYRGITMHFNLRLAILLILFTVLPMPLSTTKAQGTIQSIADIGLKLPFLPGSEWTTTSGWDAGNHQQAWNLNAVDFVPVVGSCLGQAIIAAAPGRVVNVAYHNPRHEIEIAHDISPYRTLYAHLNTVTSFSEGQRVTYGDQIGTCGGYPNYIPHLHFLLFEGTWDANDGIIPVPIDGITDQNRLRSQKRGLYSTNSGITPPKMDINTPGDGQTIAGHFLIGGWAIHEAAASGTGVNQVHIYFDGGPGSGARGVAATYGIRRDDVAAVFGDRYRYSGYHFELESSELSIGQHTIYVYAHSTAVDQWQVMSRTFTIVNMQPHVPTQAAPTNGATVSGPTVQFTWQDPGDPDNRPRNYRDYTIEVKNSAGQIVAQMPWTATTSWSANLADGLYTWHIQSGDGAQGSGWSADWGFTVSSTITKPSNLAGVVTAGGIRLTWNNNATNQTGFRIYRWRGEDLTWPLIGEVSATEFTDTHAVCGVAYSYLVSAFNSSSESAREGWIDVSMPGCPPPGAPVHPTVTTDERSATISWDIASGIVAGYHIYRFVDLGDRWDYTLVGQTTSEQQSHLDIGLNCASYYFYQISAYNANGESVRVDVPTAQTTACPTPTQPSNLTVSGTANSSVSLSWQDNSANEDGFNIYRWDWNGVAWEFYYYAWMPADATSFTDTGLSCDASYFYIISAYNSYGESGRVGFVEGNTSACAADLPTPTAVAIPSTSTPTDAPVLPPTATATATVTPDTETHTYSIFIPLVVR
jgi:fibronectin type 3 domain-containing protein